MGSGPSGGVRGEGWRRLTPKCHFPCHTMPSEGGTELLTTSSHPSGLHLAGLGAGQAWPLTIGGHTQERCP